MKKKSVFNLLIAMVVIGFLCIGTILVLALLFGSSSQNILDISNMNFVNIGLVMLIGVIFMCLIFTVLLLIIAKVGIENVADFIKNKKWEEK